MKPIFIFSLPRSGSTLLQRLLASHDQISTILGESWLLLPYFYTLKDEGTCAEYSYGLCRKGIESFYQELPNQKEDYLEEIRSLIIRLYEKATQDNNAQYFLEKTPRYHVISENIIEMFPDGKFIFLWRNPLAIISSMLETWGKDRWDIYRFKIDLFKGMETLIRAYDQYKASICVVNYESLITDTKNELDKISNYLEISYSPQMLTTCFNEPKLNQPLVLGDPTGIKHYQSISSDPLDKWKKTFTNPIRKSWCRNYLNWLGEERLTKMGYSRDELLLELETIPNSYHQFGSDIVTASYGIIHNLLDLSMKKRKSRLLSRLNEVYSYT